MSKVLVLYYSTYGHLETMAGAIAEGAREVAGTEVTVKRVPETVPADVAKGAHFKLDQAAPVATIDDLANYDAIVVGTGTRFGRMASQMANFLDQAGGLWAKGALNGKVGAAFTSTATPPAQRSCCCMKATVSFELSHFVPKLRCFMPSLITVMPCSLRTFSPLGTRWEGVLLIGESLESR